MNPILEISLILLGSITVLILAINRFKLHPALALTGIAFLIGALIGLDLREIITSIWVGFYNIISGIGIIILLGAILGGIMQKSGALDVLAGLTLKIFGPKRPFTAISVLGFFVGIPVFCDSGFILLSNVAKKVAANRNLNAGATSIALAGGLYTTHTLIPPTPGPIAAAANLQIVDQLGAVMVSGLFVSIPILLVLIKISKHLFPTVNEDIVAEYSESQKLSYGLLTPILMALVLISLGSMSNVLSVEGNIRSIFNVLANPIFALSVACILGAIQLRDSTEVKARLLEGTKQALPIILITACGGAFGQVLKQSSLINVLSEQLTNSSYEAVIILVIAYVLAFIIKTAQGSSTAALVITSSILLPIISPLELNVWATAIIVSTIGCGAMAVSHANDSYFWVVTKFSGLSVEEGYKKYSLMTFVLSLTGFLTCLAFFLLVS